MILLYLSLLIASLAVAVSSLAARARGWQPSSEARRPEFIAAWATLLAAVVVSAWLIFLPAVASLSTTLPGDGTTAITEQRLNLFQTGELVILPIVAAVLLLSATPLILRRRRSRYWVEMWGALVLAAFCVLSGFSIGMFLLPVAMLMLVAALLGRVSERAA
jgi:hypothetical protein